ncbi:MAG: 50S ribosomal protein L24 [Chloroflexi bacterium]|jgi:large subunit ribosomal protein L24|nr:50S ribosomal protein L24 [Chloroflexota bacterium]
MQRIKKGDTVEVIAGKDIGQRGEVLAVFPKRDRVVVEKVNIVKKHQKRRQTRSGVQHGIIQFEAPIHISNVMLVCKSCDKRTRVGFRINEEGKKVRVCKKCGQDID